MKRGWGIRLRNIASHPILWLWMFVALLVIFCAKSVLISTLGTVGAVPTQSATLSNYDSDSYTTHYTEHTVTTERFNFILADGTHLKATTSDLMHSPDINGDGVKLGLLGDSVVSINNTFIAQMGIPMVALFVLSCYFTVLAGAVTVYVRRHKMPVQKIRTEAASFMLAAVCASVAMGLVIMLCMMLDAFNVPGWPLVPITAAAIVFAVLRKKIKAAPLPQ